MPFPTSILKKSLGNIQHSSSEGEYELLLCEFELCISGNQFQSYVTRVLQDFLRKGIIIEYIDDFPQKMQKA